MGDSLEDRLKRQADELGHNGERVYGPGEGQSTEDFQSVFRAVKHYEREGLLEIVGEPHRESKSSKRQVDSVRVRLTREGVRRWGGKA